MKRIDELKKELNRLKELEAEIDLEREIENIKIKLNLKKKAEPKKGWFAKKDEEKHDEELNLR